MAAAGGARSLFNVVSQSLVQVMPPKRCTFARSKAYFCQAIRSSSVPSTSHAMMVQNAVANLGEPLPTSSSPIVAESRDCPQVLTDLAAPFFHRIFS